MKKHTGPFTVALWGLINLGLFLILVGFGEQMAVLLLFGSSVAAVFLIALVAWLAEKRRPTPRWRRPRNADSVLILAASILAAGLAWVFYWQLTPVAALPLLIALRREFSTRQRSA